MPVDSNAWTTLAKVKEHLQITDTSKDDQLTNFINRSYKILEKYIGRQILSRTYTEYYDGDGTDELLVDHWPIISITSIHDDPDRDFESDTLLEADDYFYHANWGDNVGVIKLLGDGEEVVFTKAKQNIKIIYVAGYATIPDDLEIASTAHVSFMYNKSGSEGQQSLSLGGFSKSYDLAPLPAEVRQYLEPYRRRPR